MARVKERQISEEELRITKALDALHQDPKLSIRAAGRLYGVPKTTLTNRFNRKTKPRTEAHKHQQLLTKEEEDAIESWIGRLDDIGIPPRLTHLHEMAASIIQQRNDGSEVRVGQHWITHFLDRHPEIASQFTAWIDNQRAAANNPQTINTYFNRLSEVKSRYKITPDDTYNADKTGFAIGEAKRTKALVRRKRRISSIRQPGNREWVSIFECISVRGKVLPPFIVYKDESHLVGWHDYQGRDEATFALSNTGWINDNLGIQWLKTHFNQYTATTNHRLLIIDRHSSHLTLEFIEFCFDHNIHLLCLPSHATHLLQPLDIGLFSPLKQYFSNLLYLWTRTHPYCCISKGDFFPLLMNARKSTFTEKNIKSAFAAAGIVPFRRHRVLDILQHLSIDIPKTTNITDPVSHTPKSTKDIENMKAIVEKCEKLEDIQKMFNLLARSAVTAFAELAIARETIKQLTTSQKKSNVDKRQISKALVISRSDLDRLRKARLEREEKKKQAKVKCSHNKKQTPVISIKGRRCSRNKNSPSTIPYDSSCDTDPLGYSMESTLGTDDSRVPLGTCRFNIRNM